MPKGVLTVLAIALTIVVGAGVWLARSGGPGIRVVAALPDAPGVRVGARVDYRGIDVGLVEEIVFSESGVVLRLHLTRADVPLRNIDRVEVRPTGLLGDRGIAIVPASGNGRAWQPGDTLGAMPLDTTAARRQAEAGALVDAAVSKFRKPDSLGTLATPARVRR
jgi:ABC-type transporter Mla subunit MlaD